MRARFTPHVLTHGPAALAAPSAGACWSHGRIHLRTVGRIRPVIYLLVIVVVIAVNVLPAFAPPTWAVLVYFRVNHHVDPVALVILGVLAAGAGRYVLAHSARRVVPHLSETRQEKLSAAGQLLARRRSSTTALVVLFLISPLPSAALFLAAGLTATKVKPLVAAFMAGRLVTYSIYVGGATMAQDRFGTVLGDAFRSPIGIAVQLVMLVLVALLPLIDWRRFLPTGLTTDAGDGPPPTGT